MKRQLRHIVLLNLVMNKFNENTRRIARRGNMRQLYHVLTVQMYLVISEVPFLCGKQTLETWNIKIDGQEKILEIHLKLGNTILKKL